MQKQIGKSGLPFKHTEITDLILGAFYDVYNALGYGFLEKVYTNALRIEFENRGLTVVQELPIKVYYSGKLVGEYFCDIVVNDLVMVEVKAVKMFMEEHEAQLLNYLKATPFEVGLLLNFGPKPQQMRRSFENNRKEWWLAQKNI
jgi:GxxExxY protein